MDRILNPIDFDALVGGERDLPPETFILTKINPLGWPGGGFDCAHGLGIYPPTPIQLS